MSGYNLSHLALTVVAPRPRMVRPPKGCKGCGGVRQKYKQWCARCHAARHPKAPPILTQDWSTAPPPPDAAAVQIAHCGRWHTVEGLPIRLPCCGVVLGDAP